MPGEITTGGGFRSSPEPAAPAPGPAMAEHAQPAAPVVARCATFVGGTHGAWTVIRADAVIGDPLPAAGHVDILADCDPHRAAGASEPAWVLRGITSNHRYLAHDEKAALVRVQAPLGRPGSTRAALIPIRKTPAWWALAQDERRAIFEEQSKHIATGLKYLPNIARRLYHCRDLGPAEPFDFLTFFDYAEQDAPAFDDLVAALRDTTEWRFVDREVDIRLTRVN